MKGPSDKCATMCRTIEQAGTKRIAEYARGKGRKDVDVDMCILRHCALMGYRETGRLLGFSTDKVTRTVQRYYEYALFLLTANPTIAWVPDPSGRLADGSHTVYYRKDKRGTYIWLTAMSDDRWEVSISRDREGTDEMNLATCPSLHAAQLWVEKRFEL